MAAGGGATTADSVAGSGAAPAYNAGSTLAAQFSWHGHTLFVINNHLDAKFGDDADFGRYQPPVLFSEIQRIQQTRLIRSFVTSLEKADPSAWVVTLGDMNDQGFEPAITTLEQGGVMTDPVSRLPLAQRYDYVFDGDSDPGAPQRRLRRPDQRSRPAAGLHQPAALGLAP